jgi:copper resistance protein C
MAHYHIQVAAFAAALAFGAPALAHTSLLATTPAANAVVVKPGKISLTFNEKLLAKFATAEIIMTAMPVMMSHDGMAVADRPAVDHATMTAAEHAAMSAQDGMKKHDPMKMTGFTSQLSKDGKTLTLLMKRALPTGAYTVNWRAAGADSHVNTGSFSFTVK